MEALGLELASFPGLSLGPGNEARLEHPWHTSAGESSVHVTLQTTPPTLTHALLSSGQSPAVFVPLPAGKNHRESKFASFHIGH